MRQIFSLSELVNELQTNEAVWLLLIKKGSEQSECAFKNYTEASKSINDQHFLVADVHEVHDIHPEYQITTVPSLLEFRQSALTNVFKGCHQEQQFRAILENAIFVAKNLDNGKSARNVIVYTTPTCSWCTTLKRHLDHNNVRYREIDIAKDTNAAEAMVRKSGQQGVPQTEVNGQMVVGFDRDRLNRLLEIN
jgi:glutaredoxin-like YruB-family protein